jgi:hypothetical protein
MIKSKTKKLTLVTTVAILVVCSIVAVQVAAKSGTPGFPEKSISIRPIEDWLENNMYGAGTGYLDPESMLSQRCLGPGLMYDEDVTYEGLITERVMPDHSLHLTIFLKVEGLSMAIRDWIAEEWIFVGVMDFTYTAEIILEKQIPGGPAMDWDYGDFVTDSEGNPAALIETLFEIPKEKRGPGAELPVWWILYFYQHEVGGHYVMNDFISDASGNFIEPGWNPFSPDPPILIPGAEGNVKVHQLAVYSDNFVLSDPGVFQWPSWAVSEGVFYDGGPLVQSPLLMPEMWPFEYVTFY